MTVITISRQFGSGGDEIASRVCEILGYKQFDKSIIVNAAREAGLSEQEVIDYSEENHKIRSFMDKLLDRPSPVAKTRIWREDTTGARISEEIQLTGEAAVALVQKAIRSAYEVGNLLILGRGGQIILRDMPDALHVRIEAPLENRIQRLKQQMKEAQSDFSASVDARREAQDWINQRDAASRDYIQRYYQEDWGDPQLYHMVLNTGKLSEEQAAQLIVSMISLFQQERHIDAGEIAAAEPEVW